MTHTAKMEPEINCLQQIVFPVSENLFILILRNFFLNLHFKIFLELFFKLTKQSQSGEECSPSASLCEEPGTRREILSSRSSIRILALPQEGLTSQAEKVFDGDLFQQT